MRTQFKNHLIQQYVVFKKNKVDEVVLNQLLDLLIQKGMITAKDINRFVILKEYRELMSVRRYSKEEAVAQLSQRFKIASSQIRTIIKDHAKRFSLSNSNCG